MMGKLVTLKEMSVGVAAAPIGTVTVAWKVIGVSKNTPGGKPGTKLRVGVVSDAK